MSCTPTDFRTRFTEFSDDIQYPDARIQLFIDDATATVNAKCPNSNLMICYLTAHLLVVGTQSASGDDGTIKPVASESVGDVSVSYGGARGDNPRDNFYSTIYGQRFLDLKKNCIGRPIIG